MSAQIESVNTESVWGTLSKINVNDHTERKGNLTYLSWAWAWGTLKDHYPFAQYEKHYYDHGGQMLPYTTDMQGFAFVTVTVTVEGLAHTETLPVLNHQNKSVKNPDAFQINTSLQRCLAKAIAMHGLGHYIYAGEDLPGGEEPKDCGSISAEQVANLEALIAEVKADKAAYLKYLKVESLAAIPAKWYDRCVEALEAKRKQA